MRFDAGWLAAAAMAVFVGPAFGQAVQEVPFELRGHKIVAKGTIEDGREVRMLIDTGASCTAIDHRLAAKLKLKKLPITTPVSAHGRLSWPSSVVVHDIRLGPIATSRCCAAADMPVPGVDMIVGLDVLRRHNFTIDFQARKLIFEWSHKAQSELPFDTNSPLIVLPVQVGGHGVRLVLDTGADKLCFYDGKVGSWARAISGKPSAELTGMHGNRRAAEVYLRDLTAGGDRWDCRKFMIILGTGSAAERQDATDVPWDGILAPGPLGIQRIHIDFRQGLVKWSR